MIPTACSTGMQVLSRLQHVTTFRTRIPKYRARVGWLSSISDVRDHPYALCLAGRPKETEDPRGGERYLAESPRGRAANPEDSRWDREGGNLTTFDPPLGGFGCFHCCEIRSYSIIG